MLIIVYIAFLSTVFTYIDNYNIRIFSVLRLFISYKKQKPEFEKYRIRACLLSEFIRMI
nr:MAG TPA: hypothetical protein [Caudoviricetes sp.]